MTPIRLSRAPWLVALSLLAIGMRSAAQAAAVRAASSPPSVVEIADPSRYARVVAVSDVHGMAKPLIALLRAAHLIDSRSRWTGGRTLVVVVGDSIDKGPDSLGVLKLWLALGPKAEAAGGGIMHLLGNHEAEFLSAPTHDRKARELLKEMRNDHVPLADLTDPARPMGAYLRRMPLAARVGRWLFCHAGLYPDMSWPAFKAHAALVLSKGEYGDDFITGNDSILEAKNWWKAPATRAALERRLEANGMFGLVQGHQPKAYGIKDQIGAIDGGRLIKIDCGMPPQAGSHLGSLLLFPHPAEMTRDAMPEVEVVETNGKVAPLDIRSGP